MVGGEIIKKAIVEKFRFGVKEKWEEKGVSWLGKERAREKESETIDWFKEKQNNGKKILHKQMCTKIKSLNMTYHQNSK